MNKQRFTKVIKETGKIRADLRDLAELQKDYPYAQAIHVLVALSLKQHNSNQAGDALNFAAMYVADRNNLKEIVSSESLKKNPAQPFERKKAAPAKIAQQDKHVREESITDKAEISPQPKASKPEGHKLKKVEKAEEVTTHNEQGKNVTTSAAAENKNEARELVTQESTCDDEFRENLMKDLENLQASKRKWEEIDGRLKQRANEEITPEEKPSAPVTAKPEKPIKPLKGPEEEKVSQKSVKEQNVGNSSKKDTKPKSKKQKRESPDKIKKQQELISKFIEKSPSIKAKANKPPIISAEQKDLSEKSTSFKDSLISENLAEIMITQEKFEKAIDIYKKLIWKFPQKKAYFAARIEELTKQKG